MANYRINQELNGIELLFDEKPNADIIASVKANGFRWSLKNKLWYAKNSAERLAFAESLATLSDTALSSAPNCIDLSGLGEKPSNFSYYGADLAKLIRNDLKKRGVKGVTVRSGSSGYTTSITVTVKATAEDLASIEEGAERYDFSRFNIDIDNDLYIDGAWRYKKDFETMTEKEKEGLYYKYISEQIAKINSFPQYHQERRNNWEFTTKFYDKLLAIYQIANQWNYDHSDSMTDYFDVGYYLDIDIKHDTIEPRATMTEEERKSLEQERKNEREEFERMLKEQEEQRKKDEEESKKYNAWVEESENLIYNDISINDLEENEKLYISGLVGGIGKECSIDELNESINELNTHVNDALITRVVTFHDAEAFERFNKLYLHDFAFLSSMGGTASEDVRLEDVEEFYKLNEEQRESIKYYSTNCVAIYLDDVLKLVIDPQGFSYARYVYLTNDCTIKKALPVLEEQRKNTENLVPFFFPSDVVQQANNIEVGETITIFQGDGWLLNRYLDAVGEVKAVYSGSWAQYEGVYIELKTGRKEKKCFIRNGNTCLIYKGNLSDIPKDLTQSPCGANMYELFNYNEVLPNIYNYYSARGIEPILTTYQH